MPDGAILANSGHFNVEIDIPALEAMSVSRNEARLVRGANTETQGREKHFPAGRRAA